MNPFYEQFKLLATTGSGSGGYTDGGKDIGKVYKGVMYQRGYGLGGFDVDYDSTAGLGFADGLMSIVRFVLPALKTGLQYLGKTAVNTAAGVATDAIAGKNIKRAATERLNNAAQDIFARKPESLNEFSNINSSTKRNLISYPESGLSTGQSAFKRRRIISKKKKVGRGSNILNKIYPALTKIN